MKDREYRTAEFFRMLDKNGSRVLSHDELASRMSVGWNFIGILCTTGHRHHFILIHVVTGSKMSEYLLLLRPMSDTQQS